MVTAQLEGNLIRCTSRIVWVAMRAPASQYLTLHNILLLNMEHSSHKSHMADMTTTGANVIHHKEHLLGRR